MTRAYNQRRKEISDSTDRDGFQILERYSDDFPWKAYPYSEPLGKAQEGHIGRSIIKKGR